MFKNIVLKITATAAIGLSMLASSAVHALWVQNLPEAEIITQFHGDPESAQLRLFMAGNQFVVMDNLIAEFKKQYPKYQEIYYVTIPPGKELQWILQGGAEWRAARCGERRWNSSSSAKTIRISLLYVSATIPARTARR